MKRKTGKITSLFILLLLIALVPVNTLKAQICEISNDTEEPVCPDIYFELSIIGFVEPSYVFNWQIQTESGYITVGTDTIYGARIIDSTVFRVIVIDTLTNDTCESLPYGVGVHPEINIEFEQLQLTCTNGDTTLGNTAQLRAIATGEFASDEYHYFWDVLPLHIPKYDSALAVDLKAHQYYRITVRDNHGCPKTDTTWTEAFPNPIVEIEADPDTAYLQNPFITFSYTNMEEDTLIPISTHFWWFSDSIPDPYYENTSDLLNPTYEYTEVGTYDVVLTVFNEQGCDTTFSTMVEIKPVKLLIPNVFTPGNGDDANEYFVITDDPDKQEVDNSLNKFYVSSELVVFNRMGRTVFKKDNYDNKWNGDNLPDGVYYYVLTCYGTKSTDVFKGSVTIIRGN